MNVPCPLFSTLRFVLVDASHPGNIGMTARAMKTMGFSRLILVNPRQAGISSSPVAMTLASNATDVLKNAETVDSVDTALSGCQFVGALTSRFREFSPPVLTAREFAVRVASFPARHAALVFGGEKYGLPNEIVEKCHALISIPANPDYPSLNLAQAVQIMAYECRIAIPAHFLPPQNRESVGFTDSPATVEQINGMIRHMEEALTSLRFLDSSNPKKLMPRLRRLFARSQLEVDEVNILRGIAKQILHKTAE
ncbi:MAG: RNA methyltransferase [Burkholderiaceae bacterium]|nr:RNA methyltransferase [Burkholderiaceae bacterium]